MFRAPSILRIVNDDHRSGSKNKVCPSQVPHRYCVVGAFHVTDIWGEKSDSCVIFKFRMQEVDLERKSDAQDSISILSNHQLGSPIGDRSLFFPLFFFFFFFLYIKIGPPGRTATPINPSGQGLGLIGVAVWPASATSAASPSDRWFHETWDPRAEV